MCSARSTPGERQPDSERVCEMETSIRVRRSCPGTLAVFLARPAIGGGKGAAAVPSGS